MMLNCLRARDEMSGRRTRMGGGSGLVRPPPPCIGSICSEIFAWDS